VKELDGRGEPLVPTGDYYVQDARGLVGNCISWWGKHRAGYVCNLDEAGVYSGDDVKGMRDTDIPWPKAYVEQFVLRHVRGDIPAFHQANALAYAKAKPRKTRTADTEA
jgi:hypothetical protein